MRKLLTLLLSLTTILFLGSSCQKADSQKVDGKPITVSLNLTGDFDVSVDMDPITKASTNDIYGVNVLWDPSGNGTINSYYGYGLFDNVQDMHITLLSHHKYTFQVTLIKNAKNTLFYGQAFNNSYSGFCYPFQTNNSGSTMITNEFVLGSGAYLSGMSSGNAHLKDQSSPSNSNATPNASVNRFYGSTANYEPVANGTVDVYLKRYVFGANIIITGVTDSGGSLNVSCGNWLNKTITSDFELGEQIHTLSYIASETENQTINLTFTSNHGKPWNLSKSQVVTFKRNVMTTVNITLNPDLSGALFDFIEEELDENDINMGINTDGYIDIDVNPED
jgi:hypothetical protein